MPVTDSRTFYFSDSWLHVTYAYDYDLETGAITNKREFIRTDRWGGRPDGATIDAEGRVSIAIYGAGIIAVYLPDGTLERTVPSPVRLCSSVMFGGPHLDQLFVTTISHELTGEKMEDNAGYVYRIDGLGARGLEEPTYAGQQVVWLAHIFHYTRALRSKPSFTGHLAARAGNCF